ncbi:hypothetical protein [Cohnella sp. GbtcB17]|uniref:hypothetical protein n=1 Tax=Cohnella sp. GbtcB17 TaxID=2824762 RepID=UPI001C2F2F37|nr:hypothetical protein [Cohnella sp. GbtcB17]
MGIFNFQLSDEDSREQMAELTKILNFLLNGKLDSLNIRELTADKINTGTLNAGLVTVRANMEGGAYIQLDAAGGLVINDGAQDTFHANINGLVTMVGALIQSSTGFPKVVINGEGDLIAAYMDENNSIALVPLMGGAPGLFITADGNTAFSAQVSDGVANLYAYAKPLQLGTSVLGDIYLLPEVGYRTVVRGWDEVLSSATGQTLQNTLDSLQDQIDSLSSAVANKADKGSSTGSAGGGNGGIPIGATWTTSAGPVSWAGIGSHSHTQT